MKVTLTREEAGRYSYAGADSDYTISRFESAYGDTQWGIDRTFRNDHPTEYLQADTLAGARATIAHMEAEVAA